MNVFFIILGMLGWVISAVLFFFISIIAQLYVSAKQQLEFINQARKDEKPTDWNKWTPPYE